MLVSLSIRDVVLIERLELELGAGLCALTGETGAGKSILLDALGLATGARGDSGLVRNGVRQATVSASFEPAPDHAVWRLLDERGLPRDEPLVLRRVISADGRSRAFVNDEPVGVGLLREIGDHLVEIQGQASRRGLLSAGTHRAFLDGFGRLEGPGVEVAAAFERWRGARDRLAEAESELAEARRDEEYLRHSHAELEALAPRPGEETELAAARSVLMHGEKLIEGLDAALSELADGRGIEARLRAAQRELLRAGERAPGVLDGAIEALDRAAIETAEALSALHTAGSTLAPDPGRLDGVEQRLFGLRAAARKHGIDVESLAPLRDDLAAKIAALEDRGGAIERLATEAREARETFVTAARRLSKARAEAARRFDRQVAGELPPLKLADVVFRTRLDPLPEDEWSAVGAERVRFEVATNPGTEPGPIGRIASGGELSRLLLAIRVVLARVGATPTLIFDEVDSGIGGAAAAAVGSRLARLGEELQVLVVTHSPQVAARADHHFRVAKKGEGDALRTDVAALAAPARREEVARMLAGARVTDEARAAADSLIRAGAA